MKVRVRDDDVLVGSSSWADPLKRFSQIHRWIAEVPDKFIHVPAILTTEIQQFPEAIEYIKSETKAGRMLPELHGFHHEIDYRTRSIEECVSDLDKGIDWMIKNLDVRPKRWYTPRGADHSNMRAASEFMNIEFISAFDNKLSGRYGVVQRLRDGADIKFLEGLEISCHWWEGGMRLKRVIEAVRYGSWAKAAELDKELFSG
jgi:hypothetical protein